MTVANGNELMGPSHKEVGTETPQCALLKAFPLKMLHRSPPANIQFGFKYMSTG